MQLASAPRLRSHKQATKPWAKSCMYKYRTWMGVLRKATLIPPSSSKQAKPQHSGYPPAGGVASSQSWQALAVRTPSRDLYEWSPSNRNPSRSPRFSDNTFSDDIAHNLPSVQSGAPPEHSLV